MDKPEFLHPFRPEDGFKKGSKVTPRHNISISYGETQPMLEEQPSSVECIVLRIVKLSRHGSTETNRRQVGETLRLAPAPVVSAEEV